MDLTIPFSDICGNTYASSYWFATKIQTDSLGENIDAIFVGWKDIASFSSGKAPIPGGVKQYHAMGQDFLSIAMASPVGSTLYEVLGHAAESYALGKLDQDSGTKDSNGNTIFVSFFNGAIQS